MKEKVLFLDQIFEMEMVIDLHFFRSPEPKIIFLAIGLCFRVCVYIPVIRITQTQIVAQTPNLVFYLFVSHVDAI